VQPAGVAFGVLAALIYAVYIVVSTGVASRVDPLAMSTVVIASAAVLFVALALVRGPRGRRARPDGRPHARSRWCRRSPRSRGSSRD
jgi:drug/metabolite transporter (DMT)-like permease